MADRHGQGAPGGGVEGDDTLGHGPTLLNAADGEQELAGGGAAAPGEDSGSGAADEPGASLRRAREVAGLDMATLARRIHLGRATVEDLEANRFDHMPPAYVRGYLRACARDLGADPEPWLAAFDRHGLTDPELRAVATRPARQVRRRSPGLYWTAGVVVVVLLGLGVYAWSERGEVPSLGLAGNDTEAPAAGEPAGTPSAGVEDEPAQPERVEAAEPAAAPAGTADAGEAGDARETGVEVAELAEPVDPVAESTAAADEPLGLAAEPAPVVDDGGAGGAPEASLSRLVLEVSEPSWVEIRDADGTVVLTGVLSSGDREEVDLQLPGRAVLGNAPGVRLRLDGSAVDLAPHTRGNNTARLDLED